MQHFRIAVLGILLLCWGGLKAQTPQAVLQAAESRFNALATYSATMGFVMGNHRDIGKVYYKGQKYHFDFPEDLTIYDGVTTMNWGKAFADISYPAPGTGPQLSAGGVYALHKFPYKMEWTDSASTIQRIHLTPLDEDADLPTVRIGINRHSGLIEDYDVHFKTGLKIEMKVLDMQLNPVLNDSLFIIDWDFVRKVERGEVPPVEHEH
jgi:outer membrane lipoprotein-sorting protein